MLVLHVALLAAIAVLVPLGAALLLRRWAAASVRSRARRELARLKALEKAGEVVLVQGKLVVDGAVEDGDGLGTELGAVTTWSSGRRLGYATPEVEYHDRAKRLDVEVAERRYELVGDVEVVSGSAVLLTGERSAVPERKAFLARTSIRDGDAVAVAGAVTDGAEGRDYRGTGPTRLRSSTDGGTLRVVSTARPRVHVRWGAVARHGALVPIGLVGMLPALFGTADAASRDCLEACSSDGRCAMISRFEAKPIDEALGDAARGRHFECGVQSDADCRSSRACESQGRCSALDGRCAATDSADCHRTRMCRDLGRCTPLDGECSVVSSADCSLTDACTDLGWCAATEGACRELSDEGCRQTTECRASGLCFAGAERCVAKRDEDCAVTAACIEDGRCSAVDGRCAASTRADCVRTRACREKGACTAVSGECRVAKGREGRSADCVASERCAADRECKLVETENATRCDADAPRCRDSDACRVHGRCSGDEVCRAETDAACAASTLCKEEGRCRAISGACVKSCAETTECREYGRCTEVAHACVVGGDDDCRGSLGCSERGGCSAVDGSCVLASAQGCKATRACRDHGWCTVIAGDCLPSDADCRASDACKKLGRCSVDHAYRCVVATDADCTGSEVCAKYGWCEALKKRYASTLECFAPRALAQKMP